MITVDFSDVQEAGLIPEGTHLAEIKEVRSFAYNSGNAGLETVWTSEGRRFSLSFNLVPKMLWKLKKLLDACRINYPEGQFTFDEKQLLGKWARVEVKHDEWNGRKRLDFVGAEPMDGVTTEPAEDEPPF